MENQAVKVANFRLSINGTELTDEDIAAVNGLIVEEELNLPAMFVIKINIVDSKKGNWRGIELDSFKPGDLVQVFLGMDSPVAMITGEIISLELTFGDNSYMEIRGYDRMHRLGMGTHTRSFKDMKDSEIANVIAKEAGLTLQTDDTGVKLPYIFQNNQSNFEFLLERARRIGYELLVVDKKLIFRKPLEDMTPELTMEYGIDLVDFSVQLKTLNEGSTVEVRGWDVKKKKEISASVSSGKESTLMGGEKSGYQLTEKAFGKPPLLIPDIAPLDISDAETIAKAQYNTILKEFITGEGKCDGNSKLRAGKTIQINGLGTRFSGIYYLVSTTHSIDKDVGYTTTFKVKRTGI